SSKLRSVDRQVADSGRVCGTRRRSKTAGVFHDPDRLRTGLRAEAGMTYEDYFLQELSSLRELGREFAEYHPRLAPFLSAEAQDPDVERLLEGFAFLGARLRQTIEDEFPELSHSLLRVLWPHV